MRKVYKINGKTEAHEVFTSPSGKTKVKVAFTKGNLDPKNTVPARYTTDSPVIQAFIENSPKFNRTIFLERVFAGSAPVPAATPVAKPGGKGKTPVKGTSTAPAPAPAPVTEKTDAPAETEKEAEEKAEEKVYPEVTKTGEAVSILMKAGAKIKQVSDYEGIMKFAKAKGISFPNLVQED